MSRSTRAHRRSGFTLVEIMAVMAVLIILAAFLGPTLNGMNRGTRVKAAADTIRARANDARAAAVGGNKTYRLALSGNNAQMRIAPDDEAFDTQATTDDDDGDKPIVAVEEFPPGVTVRLIPTGAQASVAPVADAAGWVRAATFLPDGTCREDQVILEVRELGVTPIWVRIRGLTGGTSAAPAPKDAR